MAVIYSLRHFVWFHLAFCLFNFSTRLIFGQIITQECKREPGSTFIVPAVSSWPRECGQLCSQEAKCNSFIWTRSDGNCSLSEWQNLERCVSKSARQNKKEIWFPGRFFQMREEKAAVELNEDMTAATSINQI